jgi:hypothetical protein
MGTLVILFVLSPQLAPVLGILMLSISAIVGEHLFSYSHSGFLNPIRWDQQHVGLCNEALICLLEFLLSGLRR